MTEDGAVLALDVGTSSCRASLYDLRGRAIKNRFAHSTYSPAITRDGGAELDPDILFDQLCSAVDLVLARDPPRILAVATDTFWHSLLGVDAHGKPLTPIYLWLDARSRAEVAHLRQRLDVRAVHARVGCVVVHWSYWPAKLSWLRRTQPALFKRVKRWISFGELVLERLTGHSGVSVSMASGTGLLDIHTCRFDREMLSIVGIDQERLGRISPLNDVSTALPTAAKRWPALKNVPWLLAIGDGASSNIGAGCTTPDHFAIMVGTSAAERVVWSPTDPFEVPWGAWCYRVDERRVVIGGALNDGGNLVGWLRSALRLPSLAASESEVAGREPDSHGLTVLPFWGGERSIGWADDARGAIVGLRLDTQPVDILRACQEAVALRFGELDRVLLGAMPASREIVATGGALLHSAAWMQTLADVLARPVLASAEREASSRGASLLALETLGLRARPLEDLRPATRRRFEPVPAHTDRYRAAAERQRRLYDALVK